jgi:hypothetical protein
MRPSSIPLLETELGTIRSKYISPHSVFYDTHYIPQMEAVREIKSKFSEMEKHTVRIPYNEFDGGYASKCDIILENIPGKVITSMRLSDFNNLRSIRLELGGEMIDYLESDFIPALQTKFGFQSNEIPFLILKNFLVRPLYHNVRLFFTFLKDGPHDGFLEYDYYIVDSFKTKERFEYPFMNVYFSGEEYIDRKLRLSVPLNMSYLFVENVFDTEPVLQLNGKLYQLKNAGIYGKYRVYDFTNTESGVPFGINVSKIDYSFLRFGDFGGGVGRIRVFAVSLHCLQIDNGLGGRMFRWA